MYHNIVTLSRGLLPLFYLMHESIWSIVRHKMALELAISTGLIAKRINVGAYFVVEREKNTVAHCIMDYRILWSE